ncbi:unnamed protein product [Linum tenue]|uniref:Uncharacterized protein n=1 Tax=Linum tenue TaxID=586396 RepID=A0AAV0KR77_9ROSI|nr:unnamed protein product [Linum tenue]
MELHKRIMIYKLGSLPPSCSFCRGGCVGGSPVDPTRTGRGLPVSLLQGFASGSGELVALEREGEAVGEDRFGPVVVVVEEALDLEKESHN